jgi:PAS domain S-box-containing protein
MDITAQVQAQRQIEQELAEREQVAQSLAESEERLQAIYNNAPLAILLADLDGRLQDVNPAWENMFGFAREEVIGKTTVELGINRKPEMRANRLDQLRRQDALQKYEEVFFTRDGAEIDVAIIASTIVIQNERHLLVMIEDITERKRVEAALQESEEKFRAAFDNSAIGLAITTPDGRFVGVNPAYCVITGYSMEELLKLHFSQIIYPDDFDENMAVTERMIKGEIVDFVIENRYMRKDGQVVWVRKSVSPVRKAGGALLWNVALVEDITERKHAEEAQREAEQALRKSNDELYNERNRLLAVMEAIPVGLGIYDAKGGIVQSNAEFEEVWGAPRAPAGSVEEYEAYKAWWAETGQPVRPEEWAAAAAVQHGTTVKGQFIEIQRFDGKRGYVINSGAPVRDGEGRLIGAAVAIMDITEQRRAEMERNEALIQSEIQRRLLENREQERQEIARDLHDGPVQLLSGTMFQLQIAREMEQDPMLKLELDQAALNLKSTVRELREMMNELRPPAIIRFGLSKSIRIHLEDFREKHPEIRVTPALFDDNNLLPEQIRLALFRIYQETLNNIVKHAEASKVTVRFFYKENRVRLQIHDDGRGFHLPGTLVEYIQHGHYGLAGMKERVDAIGGEFTVTSEIGKGTTVSVTVKLS